MKHERALLVRPWLPCPEIEQREDEGNNGWNRRSFYRIRSEIAEFTDGDVLGVTVYDKKGACAERFWTSRDQHGMQVYGRSRYSYNGYREPGKMYGSRVDGSYHIISNYGGAAFYATEEDEQRILDYLGLGQRGDAGEALCRFQMAEDSRRREAQKDKKREVLRKRFAGLEDPPESFLTWCRDVPLGKFRYLWFAEAGKKETTALCSHCGATVTVRRPYKEKSQGVCPACGSRCTYRSGKKMARSYGEKEERRAAVMQRHGSEIVVRTYHLTLEFRGGLKGKGPPVGRLYAREERRAYLEEGSGRIADAYVRTSVGVTADGFGQGYTGGGLQAVLWPEGIRELREGGPLRYIPIEELAARGEKLDVESLWEYAAERPQSEYLIKLGLWRLAAWVLTRPGRGELPRRLNMKGTNPAEMLRIDKADLRTVIEADPGIDALEIFRAWRKCGKNVTTAQLREIDSMTIGWSQAETVAKMATYTSLGKALKYIRSQGAEPYQTIIWWRDYMDMAKKLDIDLTDGMRVFPRHLKRAHDEAAAAVKVKENEETDRRIAEEARRLDAWRWEFDGMVIRPAVSSGELRAEGRALHHCVGGGSYARRMADGEAAIFFIRKKEAPEVPFVTLQLSLKTGKTLQCYGAHDKYPGDRVKAFYKKWEERVVNGPQRDGKPAPYTRKATERRSA